MSPGEHDQWSRSPWACYQVSEPSVDYINGPWWTGRLYPWAAPSMEYTSSVVPGGLVEEQSPGEQIRLFLGWPMINIVEDGLG